MQRKHRTRLSAGVALGALSLAGAAWAQCAPESGGVIECAPGAYDQIVYDDQSDVELRLLGDISTENGVRLTGSGDLAVTAAEGATLSPVDWVEVGLRVVNESFGLTRVSLGDVEISEAGGTAVVIDALGDVELQIGTVRGGDYSEGVIVSSAAGDVSIVARDILIGSSEFTGPAIAASTTTGRIDITANRAVSSGETASGIVASSISGDISITTGLTFSSEGNAIRAVSETGDISVVAGTLSSSEGAPLLISTAGAVSFTLKAGASMSFLDYYTPASSLAGDAGVSVLIQGSVQGGDDNRIPLAVMRGFLDIRNEGTIRGSIYAAEGVRFENAGDWLPITEMTFQGSDDLLINTGLIRPYHSDPSCCFDPGQIILIGLETFRNAGLIDLRGGGSTDNRFSALDTTYIGEAGAVIAVDFNLEDGTADHLAFAAVQGQTTLSLNLVGETASFTAPTAVVTSAAEARPDAIVLDPDSATSGFTQIALDYDAEARAFTLQALPSEAALTNLRLGWAAQDYASKSGEAWSGRLEDLRDSDWAGTGRRGRFEAWGQAVVGDRTQDQISDFAILGAAIRRDISSDTDWRGLQVGADRAFGPLMVGLTGGFLDYNMWSRARPDRFKLRGFNLGAYAAWLQGPFSLSALAKVDRFESDALLRSVDDRSQMDATAYDAQVEAAWRFDLGAAFVEPVVSADYIRAELDDLQIAGATASYSDLDSLRVRAGLRTGARLTRGAYVLTPTAGLYVTDERLGETVMDFTLGASRFSVTDHPYDAHGRADIGLGIAGPQGLAAYLKGEFDFGDGAKGATVRVGARWSW